MTRRNELRCFPEPFGDAFYFGPECLSGRYVADVDARSKSGFSGTTYKAVLDTLRRAGPPF